MYIIEYTVDSVRNGRKAVVDGDDAEKGRVPLACQRHDSFAQFCFAYGKILRRYAVEDQICMRWAANYPQIMDRQRWVDAFDRIGQPCAQVVDFRVGCDNRIHMDNQMQAEFV